MNPNRSVLRVLKQKRSVIRRPSFISHPNGIVLRVFNKQQRSALLLTKKMSPGTVVLKDLAGKPDKKIRLPSLTALVEFLTKQRSAKQCRPYFTTKQSITPQRKIAHEISSHLQYSNEFVNELLSETLPPTGLIVTKKSLTSPKKTKMRMKTDQRLADAI